MARVLRKRLSKVEQSVAKTSEKPLVCNCREATRFHNSRCLGELLKRIPRVCPVHGFRYLGSFLWVFFEEGRLLPEDRQFCPCIPKPWGAFVRGPAPQTLEGLYEVREAFCTEVLGEPADLNDEFLQELECDEKDDDVVRALDRVDEYYKALSSWLLSTGQFEIVSQSKLAKVEAQNVRRYKELMWELGREYIEHLNARTSV